MGKSYMEEQDATTPDVRERSMFPIRLSVMTLNLWGTARWPLRQPALKQLLQLFCPDILCLQELCPETQASLDEAMLHHHRVHNDFSGWTYQSNIYWNDHLVEEIEHGAEDIGIVDLRTDDRRLFWVRLLLKGQGQTVFVSTAHFSAKSLPAELQTGHSPRLEQARRTAQALQHLAKTDEPAASWEISTIPPIPSTSSTMLAMRPVLLLWDSLLHQLPPAILRPTCLWAAQLSINLSTG